MVEDNGFLESKNKTFRTRGTDVTAIEKALMKDRFLRPIGKAVKKEFGKTISMKEYISKGSDEHGLDMVSLGLAPVLKRINKRIQQQIRKVRR